MAAFAFEYHPGMGMVTVMLVAICHDNSMENWRILQQQENSQKNRLQDLSGRTV